MHRPIDEKTQQMISFQFGLPRPQDMDDLPEDDPLAQEWKAYKREVGRLLAEGHVGRHALVKGDVVISIWDTYRDAMQAGRQQFGLEKFMVHEIQPVERPLRTGYYRLCLS